MTIKFSKKSTLLLPLLFLIILLNSCEKDDPIIDNNSADLIETANSEALVKDIELTKEQLSVLEQNSIIPESTTVQEFRGLILGKNIEGLLIEDHFVSYKQLDKWTNRPANENSRLSIMENRVNTPNNGKRTIRIGIITSGFQSLNTAQRNAALNAVQRYNALKMRKLRFVAVQGSASFIMSIDNTLSTVIFNDTNGNFVASGFDGRADFPSNGNPGFLLGLGNVTRNYDENDLAVLVQHEMGHTLGLVHADFRTRRSCGGNGTDVNPNSTEVIPDTNGTGNFTNSIMRACGFFQFNNFRFEDRRSLRKAYNGNNF